MISEQKQQIEVLLESLDLDKWEVDEIFNEVLGGDYVEFIFPEDAESISKDDAATVLKTLQERCLE